MSQLTLKEAGLELVEKNNQTWVQYMRVYARLFSKRYGNVSSDDLRARANFLGWQPKSPNAWGAIFQGNEWRSLGRINSTYKSNHYRAINVWVNLK